MVEPPSKKLLETLAGLNLCTAAEVHRCRGRVRQLARDLPAFDSVWIDALLQARKLTPFQAGQFESPGGELRVGPCVLIDRLGQGRSARTCLARRVHGNERCVLKLIERPPEFIPPTLARLRELAARFEGFAHPAIVGPHAGLEQDGRLVTVSRYVPGPHLGELLVRRGRFPAAVVLEIGRQLVDGLAAWEDRAGVHGDIRLRNVRMTAGGTVVLVDAGVGPAVSPELTIHAGLPPERYDGVAPELIGTGREPNSVSDLYALGCLLWHLLAGRPPFPTGDPLAKLAAHQTREIADVREWAPETPASLAEAIGACTAREPESRPAGFREFRETWGPPRRAGRRRIAAFRAMFDSTPPRIPPAGASSPSLRWPLTVATLFLLSGGVLTMLDAGARNRLLRIAGPVGRFVEQTGSEWLGGGDRSPGTPSQENAGTPDDPIGNQRLLPIPSPEKGVITLDSNGPYAWRRIDAVGSLTIRGRPGVRPEVVIADEPCRVVADEVTLENLHFSFDRQSGDARSRGPGRSAGTDSHSPAALLAVQSQNLTLRGCTFETGPLGADSHPTDSERTPAAVVWNAVDPAGSSGGRIDMAETLFAGPGSALLFATAPFGVSVRNCLKVGPGSLFDLAAPVPAGRELKITMDRVTLRQVTALIRIDSAEAATSSGRVHVHAADCVLDLAGPAAALFQLVGDVPSARSVPSLQMTGQGSLSGPELIVATVVSPKDESCAPLDPAAVPLEGLIAAPFEFTGPPDSQPRNSTIKPLGIPGRAAGLPGIAADRLPGGVSVR